MGKTAALAIEVQGVKPLKRAFKLLAEKEAPFLRGALEESGRRLRGAAASRAPGGIGAAVTFAGVKGSGATQRAVVRVRHPGSKPMEFGRTGYYRGYTGRRMKATGSKFKASPGQEAEPYLGVKKGDQAVGAVEPDVKRLLTLAVLREYERLAFS